ncbi:hypothetical protein BBC27_10670 [Acidithiobacillus ferrivorans]|uniref:Uncharacterized protein n=1 Tax=Acidithiobacillus ferrivorans TaxID=160808 RepID=A0A1B9BYW9_9PROT|nr:hypothetical protein BBC27_10670 [Acidithiobacillus ferrivorans]
MIHGAERACWRDLQSFSQVYQIGAAIISLLNNSKFTVSDPDYQDYQPDINHANGIDEAVAARSDQEWVILDDVW